MPRRPDQFLSPWVQAARAYLSVRHGVGSRTRWTLVLLNYRFALDDAGKPEQPFCGAAGYLATGDHWAAALGEWDEALPLDLRDGKFHFTEFVRDVGAGRRRAEEVVPLLNVLRVHMRCGFSRLIHMDSWKQLPTKYQALFKHPYALCVVLLLEDVLGELQRFSGMDEAERLVTVAEYMDPYDPMRPPPSATERRRLERRTRDIWQLRVEQMGLRERVKLIDFDDRRRAPELQAADLYAHSSYRVASRRWRRSTSPQSLGRYTPASFPPALYAIMQPFLSVERIPPHYESVIEYTQLERSFPIFDEVLRQVEEGDDENDPLAAFFGVKKKKDDEPE